MNPHNWRASAIGVCRVCSAEAETPVHLGEHIFGGKRGTYCVRPPAGWSAFNFNGAPHPTSGLLCDGCRSRPIADIPLGTRSVREMFRVTIVGTCWVCRKEETFAPEWEGDGAFLPKCPGWPKHWRELRDFNELLVCPDCFFRTSDALKALRAESEKP